MAFQISPGVNVSEVDLTTVIPSVLTTAGAFVGAFQWGPANKRITVDSEITLAKVFKNPTDATANSFFTAASFLAYGNNLKVVRVVGDTSKNARANANTTAIQITNEDVFESEYLTGGAAAGVGPFIARYPGTLGNSLAISIIDAGGDFPSWNIGGVTLSSYFTGAPGTSAQAVQVNGPGTYNDEVHVAVLDIDGKISGYKNTVLEVFPYLSKASDALDPQGNSNFYKNVIFKKSNYIYAVDREPNETGYSTLGKPLSGTTYAVLGAIGVTLTGGTDSLPTTSNFEFGYDLFANKDEVDISLVLTGGVNTTIQQYAIDTLAEGTTARKDCVIFVSPPSSAVVNNIGSEADDILTWNTSLAKSSSYTVADSGWKYMFDKYNNVYRWVPLNGDIAGLCVNTDSVRDPWFSPAGFNRGNLKNVVKLAWNPNKTDRDRLYSVGINPVATFPGNGTVLYGDKTLQAKPSAFDRINVRRLFIVLEKTIAQAAKYSMFEFNDEFTRAQFVALVTPFLRDIQGRRGIYDFRVVCDTTNNTPEVIDSNRFIGDIYIKPARSINFIQLNFVAVRTGVDFTEVVGKF